MNMPLCSSLEELDAVLHSVGRPTSYSPQVIDYLCSVISERGVSDSAAARLSKVSTSSLGRWKKEHPEVRYALLAAREEFRTAQLDEIINASKSPRGWRAAAWLLERIFPEDYAPRASEREKFQELAARREAKYEPAAVAPEPAASAVSQPSTGISQPISASGTDSQNSQNGVVTAPVATGSEQALAQAVPTATDVAVPAVSQPSNKNSQPTSTSVPHSQNSQN